MMDSYDKCWLPPIEPCDDFSKYNEYKERLYDIFKSDFIDSTPLYNGCPVNIDMSIGLSGKERGFEHVITNDYEKDSKRYPDFPRCERIRWVRAFIENHDCRSLNYCNVDDCDGIKVWTKRKGKNLRTCFLFEEEYYIVIIEENRGKFFLVTAYYINYDHVMDKLIDEYECQKPNNASG